MRIRTPKVIDESHINVPLELLQTVRHDRLQWSLAALSVAIKSYTPSSCYILRSVRQFCATFHMGHAKASKLLDVILSDEGHPLFRTQRCADGAIHITAVCYRPLYAYHAQFGHNRKRYDSLCMTAVEIVARTRDYIRLSAIEREMRLRLMQSVINARNRADELQTKGCPLTGSASHAARTILSIPLLARVAGRSPRTILRMSRASQLAGDLQAIRYPLERRCHDLNRPDPDQTPESLAGLIVIGTTGFSRRCNDYQLLRQEVRHVFKHIIYSHHSRLLPVARTLRAGMTISQSELHEIYD